VSPVDDVALHARLQPERLAAHDLTSGERWSYRALDRAVARHAGALLARGLQTGDRVAVLAKNRVECVVLHLACARAGLILVPLNWRLSPAELAALVADAEPALLLGDACLDAAGLDGVAMDAFANEASSADPMPPRVIDRARPSLILYTSGTSGLPKGVLLSEANLAETAINFGQLGRLSRDSVVLCDAPMFHVIGLVTNIRPTLMHGGAILVSDGFAPARTLARLADPSLGVTGYFCVPQMAAALRAEPSFEPRALRRLVAVFTGGAPHPEASIRAWLADGVPIVDGYGMTEAGTVLGMPVDPRLLERHAGSVGVPPPRVEVRIVDRDGAVLPPGQAGELQLRGPNVTSGYWRRPEETEAAFTVDGWFRSGDIARADPEGFVRIVDRAKDMFISGGENVFPAEIEAVLADHPGIAECAVVGVPDERWGEVGHLAVVPRGAAIEPVAVLALLEAKLARYKLPKHVSLVDGLPRNGAGKVLKGELRQRLADE
jgi:fatty-acyl-CoA synthase